MATFQSFLQSGRAKDLSALLYSTGRVLVNARIEEATWAKGVRELSAVRRIFGPERDGVTGE